MLRLMMHLWFLPNISLKSDTKSFMREHRRKSKTSLSMLKCPSRSLISKIVSIERWDLKWVMALFETISRKSWMWVIENSDQCLHYTIILTQDCKDNMLLHSSSNLFKTIRESSMLMKAILLLLNIENVDGWLKVSRIKQQWHRGHIH